MSFGFHNMETIRDLSEDAWRNVWARNNIVMGERANQVLKQWQQRIHNWLKDGLCRKREKQ